MGKGVKYEKDLPRRLYTYFATYKEAVGAPSLSKFARSIGATVDELEKFKRHKKFREACEECNEIRRDYLIDNALCKRFDSSFTKFLLADEFGMGEKRDSGGEDRIDVTLEVLS